MKHFFIKSIIFFSLLVLFISTLIIGTDRWLKERTEKMLDLGDNISIIFSGDSNVEFSINDTLIKNSVNIAQSGEAYLYSYAKIRALLERNKNIKTVLLGFSYHEILKDKEDQLLFSDSYVVEKIKTFNYLLGNPEKALIFRNNRSSYILGLFQTVYNNLLTIAKSYTHNSTGNRIESFGGYVYSVRDKLMEDIRLQDNSTPDEFKIQNPQKGLVQEKYLKMISQLCHQNSVRLILLNTPKHSYYSQRISEDIKNYWLSVRNSMPQDSLYDYSSIALPDSCYGDITHLNFRGARIFSENLNEKLNSE